MMGVMGQDSAHPEGVPDRCSECGIAAAAIISWESHTSWHAGTDHADDRAVVVDFLAQVDAAALSQAALELDPSGDPIVNALRVLTDLAGRP